MEGTVKDAETGAVVASILHKRSVESGGTYSIGAWRYIFGYVSSDIARELRIRIEQRGIEQGGIEHKGQFVVDISPQADQAYTPLPNALGIKIRLAGMADERQDKERIGTRTAAFGASMGDVYLGQNVADTMLQVLRNNLLAIGYQTVDTGQDLTVEGHLQKF